MNSLHVYDAMEVGNPIHALQMALGERTLPVEASNYRANIFTGFSY